VTASPVIFTILLPLVRVSRMSDEHEHVEIVESPLSQNTYLVVWAIASIASFAIFIAYF
tara:strand:+ start:300 stop:476 length:177 start_codon:yes stop_codon:yes gene_type:complete